MNTAGPNETYWFTVLDYEVYTYTKNKSSPFPSHSYKPLLCFFHHSPTLSSPILSKHPHHFIIPHFLPIHNHHPPSSPPLFPFPLSIPSSSQTPSTFSSIEFYQSNQIPVFPFLLIHIKMNLNTQRYLQLALLPLLLAILYPYYHKSSSQSLQSDIESKVCLIHSLHNLLLTLSTSTDQSLLVFQGELSLFSKSSISNSHILKIHNIHRTRATTNTNSSDSRVFSVMEPAI